MKVVVAAVRPTPILWRRASGLESPVEVPASTLPARGTAPVRANMASRSVVLPLWNGPTSAMHRGPRGLLTSCPIAASLVGARPMIGSANGWSACPGILASGKNVAAVHCEYGNRRPAHEPSLRAPAKQSSFGSIREGWIASSHPPSPAGGLRRTRALLAMTLWQL